MIYEFISELDGLVRDKLVSCRPHPSLPLHIYNYTPAAAHTPMSEWSAALCDCRGLILDSSNGEIIGRPFRKFWNYEQVLDRIPVDEDFTVWEKLDGSLGIVCSYRGHRVVATRGSFDSDQAVWAAAHLANQHPDFLPAPGETYLFEIIYPENRIVVDYGAEKNLFLLSVMGADGADLDREFYACSRFTRAKRFDGILDFSIVNTDLRFQGQEGFVVRWDSGFRAKVKAEEYKRLHRLITQCSTRTIWELLRAGKGVDELLDRVPVDFRDWVSRQVSTLNAAFEGVSMPAMNAFNLTPSMGFESRKDFALWAKTQPNPGLLFALLDGKPIEDMTWKLVEPKWATPFRRDIDA